MQEHAVTTLLNLAIVENKIKIVATDHALDLIIEVLKLGHMMEARVNATAALFSLFHEQRGEGADWKQVRHDSVPGHSALRRECDATTALFNLADGNKAKIIATGAVPSLVAFLVDQSPAIADTRHFRSFN